MSALHQARIQASKLPTEAGLDLLFAVIDQQGQSNPGLDPRDCAILTLTARLSLAPQTMSRHHHQPLRDLGFKDTAIHDLVQVVCCFSYMNRLADGLGVALPEPNRTWATQIFGQEAVEAHLKSFASDAAGE